MEKRLRILLVDDDEEEYYLLKELLSDPAYSNGHAPMEVEWAGSYESALEALSNSDYDASLIDYHLGAHTGLELIAEAGRRGLQAPMIMLTGQGSYDVDMAAMKEGASDYLVKGQLSAPLLERSIRYAIERHANQSELRRKAEELEALNTATDSLLKTLDMETLLEKIVEAARSAIPATDAGILRLTEETTEESGGFFLQVVREKKSMISRDSEEDPDVRLFEPLPPGRTIRSLIAAPLCLGDECMGALALGSFARSSFTEEDLRLLGSFAATATAALQNAKLYERVQKLSMTDALTKVYNRRGLNQLGRQEIKKAKRYEYFTSMILFDLDLFKKVNDRHGHSVGDEVLQEVARRVQACIRDVDILARYGGEEFAILLPECEPALATQIAERVRAEVAGYPIPTKAGELAVTISLGVAGCANGESDLEEMLESADRALYRAKQNGRNRVEVAE